MKHYAALLIMVYNLIYLNFSDISAATAAFLELISSPQDVASPIPISDVKSRHWGDYHRPWVSQSNMVDQEGRQDLKESQDVTRPTS